jgi:hypothetical protein
MLNVQRRFAFLFFVAAAVTGLSCGGSAGNNGTTGQSGAGASAEGGSTRWSLPTPAPTGAPARETAALEARDLRIFGIGVQGGSP